jgi:rhodanese-related sulfurtransferase
MSLFDSLRRSTRAQATPRADTQPNQQPAPQPRANPQEIKVPEIQPVDLIPHYRNGASPLLLDCREPFEWRQRRIPGSLHIPMNDIPSRLAELDRGQEWVVVCAHGNRSYAVAGYLIHNGFTASSLAGGVTDWWMRGGPTESDFR